MRYEAPNSVQAAVKLLASGAGKARVLAGGTDLLVQLRSGRLEPELVVDVKRIPAMKAIKPEAGGFRIGAAVAGAELGEHKALVKLWPGVVEAARLIGSTQIQGRATMVGNLCNASPAADSVPALVAAGAKARIRRLGNLARLCTVVDVLDDLVVIDDREPLVHAGEQHAQFVFAFAQGRFACAERVFATLTLDSKGVCSAARVSLGAVAARVLLVEAAAKALIGTKVDEAALAKLAAAASAACRPIDDKRGTKEFRIHVAGVLARRAAEKALQRARGK